MASTDGPTTRRRVVIGVVVVVVAVGVGAGVVGLVEHGRDAHPAANTQVALQTTTVQRTDLSNSESFAGNLGYGGQQDLKGTGQGVLTKLPEPGDVATRGQALYRVNDQPVPVFFGGTPMFRKLDATSPTPVKGDDVTVVADNLRALGYHVGTASDRGTTFTATLAKAVKAWQQDIGLTPTGTLDVGQVVVLPGPVRVNSVTAALGDPVAGDLMSITSTTKVVTMPVDPTEIGTITTGTAVTIVRPDNRSVPGTVASISTTVQGGAQPGGDSAGQTTAPTITVTVTPTDQKDVADLDSAAVQVRITTQTHKGVLAVPVGALVALREGGYAVQLPGGALTAVRTGMFANGLVEVSGPGVSEGERVVTTS